MNAIVLRGLKLIKEVNEWSFEQHNGPDVVFVAPYITDIRKFAEHLLLLAYRDTSKNHACRGTDEAIWIVEWSQTVEAGLTRHGISRSSCLHVPAFHPSQESGWNGTKFEQCAREWTSKLTYDGDCV